MDATDPHVLGPGLLPLGEHVNRFRETDAEGATLDRWDADDPKAVVSSRVTWAELQGHAAFDAATTSVSTVSLTTPLGDLTCRKYDTDDGVFWFSITHPGMPVQYESDGMRTTVLSIDRD
ncbi:hypothetical protein [Microbacterium sp. PMB16]|uniref:hypothetical protein n=1 Tax=Microbacterium sp. PMB16 TaxID=3120157 RepID=UPI003F4C766C